MILEARPLDGRFVRLEPLTESLRVDVAAALATDEEAWSIMVANGGRTGFPNWWAHVMSGMTVGNTLVFAVRRLSDGAIVGATGYFGIDRAHRRVEIGSTFYRPDARSGAVNPECKLLLLRHAFASGAFRVEFLTDAINARSRAALAKIGAQEEGVLRRHKITWTGQVRDSVIFSITDEDWLAVEAQLESRLAAR